MERATGEDGGRERGTYYCCGGGGAGGMVRCGGVNVCVDLDNSAQFQVRIEIRRNDSPVDGTRVRGPGQVCSMCILFAVIVIATGICCGSSENG